LECCYHGTSSSFRTADLPEELERDNIADISCSLGHTLILSKDGIVFGSGANNYHQLTSSYDSQNTLQRITTGIKAIHAAAYCSYFIPIDPTKHLLVAGYNGWQQFGDSTIGQQASVVTEVKSWPLHLKMVSGVVSTIALTGTVLFK
jgi:alpha-tubulin suppressor-like RCC1 family protein